MWTLAKNISRHKLYLFFSLNPPVNIERNLLRWLATVSSPFQQLYFNGSLLTNNKTTSPSFLRADSQRGAAELTIGRRKRGRVV